MRFQWGSIKLFQSIFPFRLWSWSIFCRCFWGRRIIFWRWGSKSRPQAWLSTLAISCWDLSCSGRSWPSISRGVWFRRGLETVDLCRKRNPGGHVPPLLHSLVNPPVLAILCVINPTGIFFGCRAVPLLISNAPPLTRICPKTNPRNQRD